MGGRAQIHHPVAALGQYLVRAVQGLFHRLPRRLVLGELLGDGLQPEHEPLHALQQGVV